MRKLRLGVVALVLLPLFYLAMPIWAAWDLRQAVKTADAQRLGPRVAWSELKQSLKQRIVERADVETAQGGWVRRQAARIATPAIADRTVEWVVTPDRLAWLLKRRLDWRQFRTERPTQQSPRAPNSDDTAEDDDDPLSLEPSRLRWAFFESPTVFRFEVRDKLDPKRTLIARMGLRGITWQLIDVDVREPRA
jgi:hypothetical protein